MVFTATQDRWAHKISSAEGCYYGSKDSALHTCWYHKLHASQRPDPQNLLSNSIAFENLLYLFALLSTSFKDIPVLTFTCTVMGGFNENSRPF